MKLNPETKSVSVIFPIEPLSRYKIPIYQRNYSWGTDNIEEFFNDIRFESEGYYMGNLLVTERMGTDGFKIYEVVDGQQRLTTIALFLLAIYERLSELKETAREKHEDEILERIIRLQSDLKRKLLINENNEQPHLTLLGKDKDIFENYLGVLSGQPRGKYGNRVFGKRYNFIVELMNEFENYNEVDNFYKKLNALEFLSITVENISDAFAVFSSLNAKGVPLTLIDLLKSTYLGKATQENIAEDDAIGKWDQLIEIFLDKNEDPHSTAITQFFLNNYDTFINKSLSSITKKSALKKYQEFFNLKGQSHIDELIENAKIFSVISPLVENHSSHQFDKKTDHLLKKLMKLESSQIYPVQLYLIKKYHENRIDTQTLNSILEYLVNYFVRRNLVLKPKSSNVRAKIISSVRQLNEEKELDENALTILQTELGSISATDEDFMAALKGSVYDVSPKTVRVILIDLERKNGNFFDKQIRDNLDDYEDNGRPIWTLEHILPRTENLKNGWPVMIAPDNIDEATQIQQKNMHKIGNLTLTGYNPEMSDKSFLDKRDYSSNNGYTSQGLKTNLFLNKSITNGEGIESKDTWKIEDIERRTEYLAKLILDLYPLS